MAAINGHAFGTVSQLSLAHDDRVMRALERGMYTRTLEALASEMS